MFNLGCFCSPANATLFATKPAFAWPWLPEASAIDQMQCKGRGKGKKKPLRKGYVMVYIALAH